MKKVLIVLSVILLAPVVIGGLAYVTYTPNDYCEDSKIATEMYNEVSKKLGMTYREYNRLSVFESLALMKKDTDYGMIKATYDLAKAAGKSDTQAIDYGMIKATYDLAKQSERKCVAYIGLSKWERFELEVYTGEFFD